MKKPSGFSRDGWEVAQDASSSRSPIRAGAADSFIGSLRPDLP
jgi:hypothetical protein